MSNAAGRHQVHRQSWDFDIWVTSTTDSSQYRLVESQTSTEWPAWSPDGITIAYVLLEDQGSDQSPQILPTLYTIKINTGDKTPVMQLPLGWVTGLTWSPDGRYLAFVSIGASGAPRLYRIRADGSDLLPLTEAVVDAQAAPAWLPDSRHLYFDGSILDIVTGTAVEFEPAVAQTLRTSGVRLAGWSDPQGDGTVVDCTQGWTHLVVGGTASVNLASEMPNRVRSGPSRSDAVITQILPGTTVKLLAGPVCADGLVFWQVESAAIPGGVGWTAEGDGVDHWLVP
ncbi:MAG TPA: DPP IV N-terminal domain-containing protein, partial [Anaerolineaceae bacterium]|nr:DPP IV N-terminal domain-containing protein [Anaerolineaceae bacterium]